MRQRELSTVQVPVQPPQIAQQTQIFYRLVQQAVAIKPATFKQTVDTATKGNQFDHNLLGSLS